MMLGGGLDKNVVHDRKQERLELLLQTDAYRVISQQSGKR